VNSVWGVLALSVLILIIAIVQGKFSTGLILALAVLVLIGALAPPVALGLGLLALLVILMQSGAGFFAKA